MLIKLIIILLCLYEDVPIVKINTYDLAKLQLMGLIDDNNNLTAHGRVIVQEILSYVERVI